VLKKIKKFFNDGAIFPLIKKLIINLLIKSNNRKIDGSVKALISWHS
jgi:hypothetical protein